MKATWPAGVYSAANIQLQTEPSDCELLHLDSTLSAVTGSRDGSVGGGQYSFSTDCELPLITQEFEMMGYHPDRSRC